MEQLKVIHKLNHPNHSEIKEIGDTKNMVKLKDLVFISERKILFHFTLMGLVVVTKLV